MSNLLNKPLYYFLVCISLLSITLISCKKNKEVIGTGYVRVVNTVAGSNAQDFYQIDTKINASPVAYGTYSTYQSLKSGANVLFFKDAVSGQESAKPTGGITVNGHYTVFYYVALDGSYNVKGLRDEETTPATGKARVRFVNFNRTINNSLDIKLADGTSIGKIPYFTPSNYGDVVANANLTVTDVATQNTVSILGEDLLPGKIYTIWFDSNESGNIVYHMIQQN